MLKTIPPHRRLRSLSSSRERRPDLPGFDDVYDDILRVVRTGIQWRYLLICLIVVKAPLTEKKRKFRNTTAIFFWLDL